MCYFYVFLKCVFVFHINIYNNTLCCAILSCSVTVLSINRTFCKPLFVFNVVVVDVVVDAFSVVVAFNVVVVAVAVVVDVVVVSVVVIVVELNGVVGFNVGIILTLFKQESLLREAIYDEILEKRYITYIEYLHYLLNSLCPFCIVNESLKRTTTRV